jgi:ethanolamine utilization protein EutN
MILGRVTGRVVATRKDESLLGTKLLMVEEVEPNGTGTGELAVVADNLGAGPGDVVLISQGSAARFTEATKDRSVDALVVGIVDSIRVDRVDTFEKSRGFAGTRPARRPRAGAKR